MRDQVNSTFSVIFTTLLSTFCRSTFCQSTLCHSAFCHLTFCRLSLIYLTICCSTFCHFLWFDILSFNCLSTFCLHIVLAQKGLKMPLHLRVDTRTRLCQSVRLPAFLTATTSAWAVGSPVCTLML
jgi:hypothetical protein